jgi:hypothetical protein
MTNKTAKKSSALDEYAMAAYAAMQAWGDRDRDDRVLEGACEVTNLSHSEVKTAGELVAAIEAFRLNNSVALTEFLPILLAVAAGGVENLAIEYGVTIPRCASTRAIARKAAIRSLAA